jgi:hypothetical protein
MKKKLIDNWEELSYNSYERTVGTFPVLCDPIYCRHSEYREYLGGYYCKQIGRIIKKGRKCKGEKNVRNNTA